jgi:hypothetical protein
MSIGTVKGWLISLCGGHAVMIGSRVMTPNGVGTITNGTVQVNLDRYAERCQSGVRNQTFTLDKVHVKS